MRIRKLWSAVATTLLVSLMAASGAEAQGQERARALFEAGRVAVSEGDYESAYRYFTEAHERSQRPRLLFNMANAAERLRRDDEALAHYRQYLEQMPDAENATYVNSRIDALLTARAEPVGEPALETEPASVLEPGAGVPAAVPQAVQHTARHEPASSDPPIAGITLLAGGGAAAVAGAIMVAVAAAEQANVDSAAQGSSWEQYRGSQLTANTLAPIGAAVLGVGAAIAVVGGVVLATSDAGEEQVALIPTGTGLQLRGSF